MNVTAEYDIRNLQEKISGLTGVLFGRGAVVGDLQKVLDTETGQLAGRMGDAVGPSTQSKAMEKIDADIKQHLTTVPRYSNLDEGQQDSSYADFTWLVAGKHFVLGINDEDNQIRASGAEAMKMLRAGQNSAPRGPAYIQLGQRGFLNSTTRGSHDKAQYVNRLNRVRVSQSSFNFVRTKIKNTTGELRAAFYRVAVKYVPSKRVPAWISSKFDQVVAKGKSSDHEGGRNTAQAFIEFSIRAPGVTSNARITAKLQGAVKQSSYIINEKLKKILRGYKYDWDTGKIFRSQTGDDFSNK